MPKKSLPLLLLLSLIFMGAFSPVHAMLIKVSNNGDVTFVEQRVLGEDDETEEEKEVESEQKQEKKLEQEREQKKVSGDKRETVKTELRIKPEKTKTKIELKRQDGKKVQTLDKREVDRLEVEFEDEKTRAEESEVEDESKRKQNPQSLKDDAQLLPPPEKGEQEVTSEMKKKALKLRDSMQQNTRQLELEDSKGVARFSQGAEISVEPETGKVTLMTPSGIEKPLQNFPDDVVKKLEEQSGLHANAQSEVEVSVDENGNIKHKVKNIKRSKRLFGLIPREVAAEAVVDDQTGEVEVTDSSSSVFDQVLNVFSL